MSLPVGALASKSRDITAANCSSVSSTEKSSAPSTAAGNTSRPCRLMTNGFTPTSRRPRTPTQPRAAVRPTRFPLSGTGLDRSGGGEAEPVALRGQPREQLVERGHGLAAAAPAVVQQDDRAGVHVLLDGADDGADAGLLPVARVDRRDHWLHGRPGGQLQARG